MAVMEATELSNDTRGWIMCLVSGTACVLGASVINVDVIVRLFPGKKNFRVQDSNAFLAASLSLSFGVMLFMSLYSMLPSAKKYLSKGGYEDPVSGLILMASFVAGFVGIQIVSRLFHQLLPSHVVDCDHSHGDDHEHSHGQSRRQSSRVRSSSCRRVDSFGRNYPSTKTPTNGVSAAHESTPLLTEVPNSGSGLHRTATIDTEYPYRPGPTPQISRSRATTQSRRPSMLQVQKRVLSFVKDTKSNCDEQGPCYGYTDPCGQECFKHISSRVPKPFSNFRTTSIAEATPGEEATGEASTTGTLSPTEQRSRATSSHSHFDQQTDDGHEHDHDDLESQHHHHVPQNAFLSIGLQTSIAIALHKFPEGFITYATNHANPELGFSVFLALFVHNISEGFAMALPLYMALNSRTKAIMWSSVLGGLSQPLGAGIAALWFKFANHSNMSPDEVAYGCLFAVTAGIMTSVAIHLFVESLSLNHNRNLSIVFAVLGMTLLGVSSAFTSHDH
ncbi:Zinc/iron permease [Microdochium trichocladiopsis]|uniref:Zinc/iron permease n=1 Tax=Microdochium trichocladiopsis TaxID=1682393 RepID=A0A9P8YHR8_9PEZI|nr:Zinc/iron permease [Microdochium trichocladiopsis]KAH7038183.1 Zinc/iron permease [Microdochium trichocladiopsis]